MSLNDDVTVPEAAEEQNPQEISTEDQVPVEEESTDQKVEKALSKIEEKSGAEPKEEKEHEPPPESPRFKKVYGKMKVAERKVGNLEKELEKLKNQIKGVSDERIQEKEKETDAEIDRLWNDYSDAITELDGKKAAQIHRKINQLEKKRVEQVMMPPKEEDIDKKIKEREAGRAAEKFKKRNTWFNKDSEDYNARMRKLAIVTEDDLLASGFDGSYDDLLLEVEKEVLETVKAKRPSGLPNVVGVNSTRRTTTTKVINLTDEQKTVAHGVYSGLSKPEAEKKYIEILKKQGGTK
jgi:hypothetical protein